MQVFDNSKRKDPLVDPHMINTTFLPNNNQENLNQFHSNLFQIIRAKTKMKTENDSNSLLATSKQYKLFTQQTGQKVNRNHSNCKLNSIAASLAMIKNRHSARHCTMPAGLLSKIHVNNNRTTNESDEINERNLAKDHTFKLVPPEKFFSSNTFTKNNQTPLHKHLNDKLLNSKNNHQKNNKSNIVHFDKTVDTMDLEDFIREDSFEKITEDNDSHLLQTSSNSNEKGFKSIEMSNKTKEKPQLQHAILNFTNLPIRNKIGLKNQNTERRKVNCNTSANEICNMLNDLIKDLNVGKDNLVMRSKDLLKSETTSKIEEESLPLESSPKETDENFRCQSALFDKSLKAHSSSIMSFNQSISSHNFGQESSGLLISREEIYADSPKTDEKFTASFNNLNFFIRTFIVNQFDDLIKSHLSVEDRRIKAISKRADCQVEIMGPLNAVTGRGLLNTNWKIIYHCYLISDTKEKCNKCLKCLQDSFPFTRLKETSSKMPIDKKYLHLKTFE